MSHDDESSRLRAENERLRAEIEHLRSLLSDDASHSLPRIHYLYASPLVLMESLGSMVIDTFDPLRVENEFRSIRDATSRSFTVSVTAATTANLNRLTTSGDTIVHIAMHTIDVTAGISRCVLDDDHGRGYLMSPDEFFDLFRFTNSYSPKLVFLNACKSFEIGKLIESRAPNIDHVICTTDQVYEISAQVFAKEFYLCITNKLTVEESFQRAKLCLKSYPSQSISQQHLLFKLLPENSQVHKKPIDVSLENFYPKHEIVSSQTPRNFPSFWVGYICPEVASVHEDFVGRQVDIVRLCGLMFPFNSAASSRRVCLVTGQAGIGKDSFLSESMKLFSSPGGRPLSFGGVCVVKANVKDISSFFSSLITGVKETISSVTNWTSGPNDSDHVRVRTDSSSDESQSPPQSNDLKSYKVFWAETFSDSSDLLSFLKSYDLSLSLDIGQKLFNELRSNGTQLQDWGGGKLVRLVHVVRCLIRHPNDKEYILVEKRHDSTVRMLSKKFDPVTENVLEIARFACSKELGDNIKVISVVLRDRKPQTEIHNTSPSYPGLSTKYLLYTVEVELEGLSTENREAFTTIENPGERMHHWEWLSSESDSARDLYPDLNGVVSTLGGREEVKHVVSMGGIEGLKDEFLKQVQEWGIVAQERSSALVLLQTNEWMQNQIVREVIGKALIAHRGLKIFYSDSVSTDGRQIGSYKVVNFPLPPLQPIDAALLFTRRIHRPLYVRDWYIDEDAPPPMFAHAASSASLILDEIADAETPLVMTTRTSKGVANLARLARHPLLQCTNGIPAKISEIAQHVTTDLVSINDLVLKFSA